jgi:hypothetical protein
MQAKGVVITLEARARGGWVTCWLVGVGWWATKQAHSGQRKSAWMELGWALLRVEGTSRAKNTHSRVLSAFGTETTRALRTLCEIDGVSSENIRSMSQHMSTCRVAITKRASSQIRPVSRGVAQAAAANASQQRIFE